MPTTIQSILSDHTARITLIPEDGKPPVLEMELLEELGNTIQSLYKNPPRILILESSSDKFFCLGADLNVLKETTPQNIGSWVQKGHQVLNLLEDLPCPTIAKVAGYAMGGGLEIAMACDLIFAESSARFGQTEAGIGFIPGWGGTFRLEERIGTSKSKLYFYTGDIIDARVALRIGLADFAGTPYAVSEEIRRVCLKIEQNSSSAVSTFKKITHRRRAEVRIESAEIEATESKDCVKNPNTKMRIENFFNRKK